MSIKILDDIFSPEEIVKIHRECLTVPCTWAAINDPRWKFWNGQIVSKQFNRLNDYPNIMHVWETAKHALELDEYRIDVVYVNGQSLGNESPLHNDYRDLTFIYYSNPNWKLGWDGGTSFYNQERNDCIASVSYKGGRIVAYDSSVPHKPQAISMYANDIRIVLVFKLLKN